MNFFVTLTQKKINLLYHLGEGALGLMGLPSTLPSTKLFWIVQVLKIGTCYDILKHLAQGVKVTYAEYKGWSTS